MKKSLLILILLLTFFSCSKDETIIEIKEVVLPELSIISINTVNLAPIVSKDDYINGTFEISGENEDLVTNLRIRGRGNTTWSFPKKPYQIKFDNKENVLGMPKDKKWILLANYSDKTMLRNELAFVLSRFSNLDWTPSC